MSNAILKTESRSLRLLLVVLMASVGLSLLVGCGKKQGQVVGGDKTPSCVGEDCKGHQRGGDRASKWRSLYGETPVGGSYYGPDVILGLDVLDSKAEGALWVNGKIQGSKGRQLQCDWYWCYWVEEPCEVTNGDRYGIRSWSGSFGQGSIQGTVKFEKGLTLKIQNKFDILPGSFVTEDPDGYDYDEYLFGSYTIENDKGCRAFGALAPPPSQTWGPY